MTKESINIMEEPASDYWGGIWTHDKMDIFRKYIKAYLQIMKNKGFELIYFDGFAGSGIIRPKTGYGNIIEGVALQVLSINEPVVFDLYYLVELNKKKATELEKLIGQKFPDKIGKVHIANVDCNEKLFGLSDYVQKDNKRRALAFIDPHGMAVNWQSLETFKGLYCDMWILVPTGIGVNRMLTKDGEIDNSWLKKLSTFLGIKEEEIKANFYLETTGTTLFGQEEKYTIKSKKAINKIIEIYTQRLATVWQHVSQPFPMANSKGSLMFHFLLVSQHAAGIKIANEIIGKKLRS